MSAHPSPPSFLNRLLQRSAEVLPLRRPKGPERPRLSLALQGGGAHGAYTWGVLDALLEADCFELDAVSGTSAGAMNAVVLAHGMMEGGAAGARAALERFWLALGEQLPFEWLTFGEGDATELAPQVRMMMQLVQFLSPAQINPLRIDPLRELLASQLDLARLRRESPLPLYLAATHANSGRLRLFARDELCVEAVLASACLPSIHHTVLIDGEPYWDGGYSANPALQPLLHPDHADDVLIVMLNPLLHQATPVSAAEIRARAVELAFTAPFLREAALIGAACAAAQAAPWWRRGSLERQLARLRWHLIDAQQALGHLPGETRLIARRDFLLHLRDQGRARAHDWLVQSGECVGRASSTDLRTWEAP